MCSTMIIGMFVSNGVSAVIVTFGEIYRGYYTAARIHEF